MAQVTAINDDSRWTNTLGDLWRVQSQWSRKAVALKAKYRSWTGPLVLMGFAGVVLSTLSPELVRALSADGHQDGGTLRVAATIAGPLLVAIAAALTRELLGRKSEQQWVKARGVAEGLKAEGYIYAAGAPPYLDRPAAPEQLARKMGDLIAAGEGITDLPDPDPKAVEKRPHAPLTADEYIAGRGQEQIAFHQKEARAQNRRLESWRAVGVALAVLSAVLGVIAGVRKSASINVWVAVVSTAIATVTALVYAGRFEFFVTTYWSTAQKLGSLIRTWQASADQSAGQRGRFVLDCEAVLAAQNQLWAAELTKRIRDEMKQAENPPQRTPGS